MKMYPVLCLVIMMKVAMECNFVLFATNIVRANTSTINCILGSGNTTYERSGDGKVNSRGGVKAL